MKNPKNTAKETVTLNKISDILKSSLNKDVVFSKLSDYLSGSWYFDSKNIVKISFDNREYLSHKIIYQNNYISKIFTSAGKEGIIKVYTKKEKTPAQETFLKKVCELIENNFRKYTRSFYNQSLESDKTEKRELLHRFLNENNYPRDLYHDLMQFKVKEILLVGSLYDAYSLESEGRFAEEVLGEYRQLNLTFTPRITGVSTEEEALKQLNSKNYDLVIFVIGIDKKNPAELAGKIKSQNPFLPVFFLVNNNSDIAYFKDKPSEYVDRVFSWNGDSSIFFVMIKLIEDFVNCERDTSISMVRVILLVEDSPKYYSRVLPLLYRAVLEQTRKIIDDVEGDELYKLLRLRARPKILLAQNYEEAIEIIHKYKEYLQCVLTDVRFSINNEIDDRAGYKLIDHIHKNIGELPVCIQSCHSTPPQAVKNACFIDKTEDSTEEKINNFINEFVGFGKFIFRDDEGSQLGIAKNLREFDEKIKTIPDESLQYHAVRNHYSLWLMARGEIQLARIINPYRLEDFENMDSLRSFLLERIDMLRNEKTNGKVIPFNKEAIIDDKNIVEIGTGPLGGKGRGLAFTNSLLYNFDFSESIKGINIKMPKTIVIGTDVYSNFLKDNNLTRYIRSKDSYHQIRESFIQSELPDNIKDQLLTVIQQIKKPLAVRSSSLLEDSLNQPFSGIFETYLIPNNHEDDKIRLKQLCEAVKMVYSSLFSPESRDYIKAINYKLEEEKMAVVIQEIVGNKFDDHFYPHISGVAQSYNYYPVSHMSADDGFAIMALGLGEYVVSGEKAFRFCPSHPKIDIVSTEDMVKETQTEFYAVDMNKKDIRLIEGEQAGMSRLNIDDAEMHGSLKHLASVYNPDNNTITAGLSAYGPRVINFANILKHNYIPLASTIQSLLNIVREALGTTAEIEFAIDLNKDDQNRASFYILQVKPLIGNTYDYELNPAEVDNDNLILRTDKAMGNGKIDNIEDIIYIDPESFDKLKTEEMAVEIGKINSEMTDKGKDYVLIGPGRWGSRDKFIGIPVRWAQISGAKLIVEYSFEGFPLDPSSGSHFFHNVTSMNVGYLSVQQGKENHFIKWEKLTKNGDKKKHKYFTHIKYNKPVSIKMDSRHQIAVVE